MASGKPSDFEIPNSPNVIQSLARGLAVIRAMGGASAPLTITEVAGSTGLTRAGARRILLTLETLGYVRLKGRHFALTPRIMELGKAFEGSDVLWDIAEPHLNALVSETMETASAGVLDDLDVVYVLRVKPARRLHFALGPGARLPAHVSSMGRVLLADLPPRQLDFYFARATIERYTASTVVDEKALRRVIAQAGKQGYAIVNGEMDETITGISVPVRNRILPRLLGAATQIQRSLRSKEAARVGRAKGAAR